MSLVATPIPSENSRDGTIFVHGDGIVDALLAMAAAVRESEHDAIADSEDACA